MAKIKLVRTKDVPLEFEGERFAEGRSASTLRIRRFRVTLYRTNAGQWVLATEYRSLWPGEKWWRWATHIPVVTEAKDVGDFLRGIVTGSGGGPPYMSDGEFFPRRWSPAPWLGDRLVSLWHGALLNLLLENEAFTERIE